MSDAFTQTALESAADEIARLQAENEALRFAITGGEDAPGHIASLPLQRILDVADENLIAHLNDIDTVETLLQIVGALTIASAYADTFPDDAEDAKSMQFGNYYWQGAADLWAKDHSDDLMSRAHEAAKERMLRENPVMVKQDDHPG